MDVLKCKISQDVCTLLYACVYVFGKVFKKYVCLYVCMFCLDRKGEKCVIQAVDSECIFIVIQYFPCFAYLYFQMFLQIYI